MNKQIEPRWKLTNRHTGQTIYCANKPNMDGNIYDGWNASVWLLEPPQPTQPNGPADMDANPYLAQSEPPSYYELRSERDELAVENAELARKLALVSERALILQRDVDEQRHAAMVQEEYQEMRQENAHLTVLLERMEDQLKTYKTRGDRLQSALMALREEALDFCRLYDECVDRTKLGASIEALQQRGHGANATLAAYGEDPY